jgi:GntR family transcriptional regulator
MNDHRLSLVISNADARPMYVQIMEQIKQRVAIGNWPEGQEIPSIRQLAIALRVSVITVKRAYLELEREGVIVTQQGKGSIVAASHGLAPRLLEQELDKHLDDAARLAQRLGMSATALTVRMRAALERRQHEREEEEGEV